MTNIYKLVCDTLSTLGYPVREQGTYAEGDMLPETHVTYQILYQPNGSHADNAPTSTISGVQVTLYSKDPAIVQSADDSIKAVMIPAGFMRAGGRPLPFDKETGHYSYASTYNLYEMEG